MSELICKGSLRIGSGCGECSRCAKEGKEIAKKYLDLLDQQRKRPPSEKPGDGEVVLVKFAESEGGGLWLGQYIPGKYPNFQVDGWWPIKYLVEGEK